jgi:chromosome transmission fidelity protein 4
MIRSRQDKITLKLFAALVDAGKLEAALDLVDRLHLEMSYDLAIRIADRHDKLADEIETAKNNRFESTSAEDDGYGDVDDDGYYASTSTGTTSRRQISPETQKRSVLQEESTGHVSKKHRFN